MSKIAEKKAKQLYPFKSIDNGEIEAYFNAGQLHKREIYIECYDQAMQDFLEKAENAISMISRHYIGEDYSFEQVWEQFKNYMQNEM